MTRTLVREQITGAVESGREMLSPETGFIHLGDQIPLFENILFALALLKTRSQENVLEAKEHLSRILVFREAGSCFPSYMHEYPKVTDLCQNVRILAALVQCSKLFQRVLGLPDLDEAVDELSRLLLEQKMRLPQASRCLLLALTKGEIPDFHPYYTPVELGDIFLSWQMADKENLPKSWDSYIPYSRDVWDPETGSYAGPALSELQAGYRQKLSFYHLAMRQLFSSLVPLKFDGVDHLWAALLLPLDHEEELPKALSVSGEEEDFSYRLTRGKHYAYAACQVGETEKALYPFRLAWRGKKDLFSLLLAKGKGTWDFEEDDGLITLYTDLGEVPDLMERSKARELQLFVRKSPELTFFVEGQRACTFRAGERVHLQTEGLTVELSFDVVKGDALMMGHIHPGNRPGQLKAKGEGRFDAYDWKVFLRTVERSGPCRIKLSMRLVNGGFR